MVGDPGTGVIGAGRVRPRRVRIRDRGSPLPEANRGEWGGADLGDLIAGLDWLERSEVADTKRAAAYGGSYGGYLTLMALTSETAGWAAGCSVVGVVSWQSLYDTTRGDLRDHLERELADPKPVPELYRDRSRLRHASNITAPILIPQGANDPRVLRAML